MKNYIKALFIGLLVVVSCNTDDCLNGSSYSYKSKIGNSANDILSNKIFTDLTVELMYVKGFKPQDETLKNFRSFIASRTFKENIFIDLREIDIDQKDIYTVDEVRIIEDEQKLLFTSGKELVITALFLNGKSSSDKDNSVILGTAYRNTSFVIFEETIHNTTSIFFGSSRINLETSVILHEFCHLLGLVNIGSPMITNHHDKENDYHCTNTDCIMYYQEEFHFSVSKWNMRVQIPQLGKYCLQDIQANGGR